MDRSARRVIVQVGKVKKQTRLFNQNQKVWLLWMSGDQAAFVTGKHRGRHRYIQAWVCWRGHMEYYPGFKEIEVTEYFARKHEITYRHAGTDQEPKPQAAD